VLRAAIVPQPITATLVFVMANSSYNTFWYRKSYVRFFLPY
jgi:hypothetical protein